MSRSASLLNERGDDSYSYRGHLNEDTHRTGEFGPSGGGLSSSASLFYAKNRKAILIGAGITAAVLLLIIIIAVATKEADKPDGGNGDEPAMPAYTLATLGGMTAYVYGSPTNPIVLYLPDINGLNSTNNANQALALSYANAGFYVWALDYFDGGNGFAGGWTIDNSAMRVRMAVAEVRANGNLTGRSIFSTGYCWGGGVGVQLTYTNASMMSGSAMVDVSVVAHAAQVTVDRYSSTVSPLLAIMPQNDNGFNANAGAFINTTTYQPGSRGREAMFKVYPGVNHGFAVSVSSTDANAVKQKQMAFDDTVAFFNAHLPVYQARTAVPDSKNITLGGMNTLQIGSGTSKLLLYFMDINGWVPAAVMLATQFATAGFTVFMPDYFNGTNGRTCGGCTVTDSARLARLAVADLRANYPGGRIFSTGYCWGGGVGISLASGDNMVDVVAVAHASSVTSAMFNSAVAPILAVMPQNDNGFNAQVPGFMAGLTNATTNTGREASFKVYPGVSHGFAVTASLTDANAMLQKARAFNDTITFYNLHM